MKKRQLIYFFYDKDGIVDDYIIYMLKDLKKNVENILFVCNGKLDPEGRRKVSQITKDILVRENKGFDVWAYKEGIESIGWDKISEYDELILMNFTIMGPLYPFKEVFNEMDKKDVDFWGLTAFHKVPFDPFNKIKYGYIPKHIQSHFIVIRKEMLRSKDFINYWENMPEITCYEEAVGLHEAIFTKEFNDKGFSYEVYVDTDDLIEKTHCPILFTPLEIIKNKKCPIFKRRSFFHDYSDILGNTSGEVASKLFEYIETSTKYDTNLILENIIRVQNMLDIKRTLQLNYILPRNYNLRQNQHMKKVALVLHIYFKDLIESCFEYSESMPKYADIIITTDTEEKKRLIEKTFKNSTCKSVRIEIVENRGRDVSALLVGAKKYLGDYEYVCFAHDKKTSQVKPGTVAESFASRCFENVLSSKEYVENIIKTLEDNSKLGMLVPAGPNHAHYYSGYNEHSWGPNYQLTKELSERLNLNVPISEDKEPVAPLGTMFWFKPKALKKLLDVDWTFKDFPKEPNLYDGTFLHAVERIYPFVVQDAGYLIGYVYHDKYAAIDLTNLEYMLKRLNSIVFKKYGHNNFHGLVNTMNYIDNSNQNTNANYMITNGWIGLLKTDVKHRLRNRKILLGILKTNYKFSRNAFRLIKKK